MGTGSELGDSEVPEGTALGGPELLKAETKRGRGCEGKGESWKRQSDSFFFFFFIFPEPRVVKHGIGGRRLLFHCLFGVWQAFLV